jgi:NADPH:quinone reductase-like Zn-dependent oxidoreductase
MGTSPLDVIFKPLTVRGFFMGHPEYAAKIPSAVKHAAAMISSGEVRLPVSAVYPISAIKEAVAHALRGGKILLKIGESSA